MVDGPHESPNASEPVTPGPHQPESNPPESNPPTPNPTEPITPDPHPTEPVTPESIGWSGSVDEASSTGEHGGAAGRPETGEHGGAAGRSDVHPAQQDPWFGQDDTEIRPLPVSPAGSPPTEPGATRILPSATGPDHEPARWSARAGVPELDQPDWVPQDPHRGIWWLPVLVGLLVLILLAALGFGLWLALRGDHGVGPAASPTPSPTPSLSPTVSPTSSLASPSFASPTPSIATVVLPELRGLSLDEAEQLLDQLGLTWTVQSQTDASAPPATVLGSTPDAGAMVPTGGQVVLRVAVAPPSDSPTPSWSPGDSPTPSASPK